MRFQSYGDSTLVVEQTQIVGSRPTGVTDIVPAFGSCAVHFDPTLTSLVAVATWLDSISSDSLARGDTKLAELSIAYGGEFGPDLESIASRAGLAADEVIRRHAAAEYRVGAIGFQPGFPYLEGLPAELHTPRQATPRTRVAAGSVGIGGPYTGVYPSESPGGWNLIGRTPLTLFDPLRAEPSLLRTGDRVRFRPIDAEEFARLAAESAPTPPPVTVPPERPLFRVISPGVQTTVQGLGRFGQQHLGVGPGGAMDTRSLRLANLLVGNDQAAPAIEATLVGPVLECLEAVTVGVAGALPSARRLRFNEGQQIDLRQLTGGARAYLALPGGVTGEVGEPLRANRTIGSLAPSQVDLRNREPLGKATLGSVAWPLPAGEVTLRVLPGPDAPRFSEEALDRLRQTEWTITPQSNRMGLRCDGPPLDAPADDDAPSQPVVTGAVQVPPDGQPIVLAADRQTLGGYPVIGVVASVDWPRLGQLRPDDTFRFEPIDLPTAQRLRRQAEREIAIAAVGLRLS
ncbi:KipI antagonist [Planctomycetes bacterium MalM25]|nr:KipI antagonist [Planctomycetes bacterium MalM25]